MCDLQVRFRLRSAIHIAGNMARAPVLGDRMIVVKEPYTSLIMDGTKTLELRSRAVRGEFYLADSTTHTVKGKLTFGESRELSQEEYENARDEHCVEQPTKRYKKTFGTVITSVQPVAEEPPYEGKRGAIGFVRFQPAIPKTLRIMKTRDDCVGDNHGRVITGAVRRLAAKVEELPAVGAPRRKERRLGLSVSTPVLSEPPRTVAAFEAASARHQAAAAPRSNSQARS